MSDAARTPPGRLTVSAFQAWAETQARGRFELLDGEVVAMAPERIAHVRAKSACWLALRAAIAAAGVPCEAIADGGSVVIGDATSYEPDVVIACGEIPEDVLAVPSPMVVVEVASPSNSRVDLVTKFADYFRLPSLRHYVIVHLALRRVIHHRRTEDGRIESAILTGGALALEPPGISVAVEALFGEDVRGAAPGTPAGT
jgi:Uma2 family endonuclease